MVSPPAAGGDWSTVISACVEVEVELFARHLTPAAFAVPQVIVKVPEVAAAAQVSRTPSLATPVRWAAD